VVFVLRFLSWLVIMVLPYLRCECCHYFFDSDNYPVQSLACGDSICKPCVMSKGRPTNTAVMPNNTKINTCDIGSNAERGTPSSSMNNVDSVEHRNKAKFNQGYFACPVCRAPYAFHPNESPPNLLACAAMCVLQECEKLLEAHQEQQHQKGEEGEMACATLSPRVEAAGTTSILRRNVNHGKNPLDQEHSIKLSPAIINNSDSPARLGGSSTAATNISTSTVTALRNTTLPEEIKELLQHNKHDDLPSSSSKGISKLSVHDKRGRKKHDISTSPTCRQQRIVWVKFGQRSCLAYLLSTHGDKASIRWESNKYEEEVPIDMIEEMSDYSFLSPGSSGRLSKRSRRRSSGITTPYRS